MKYGIDATEVSSHFGKEFHLINNDFKYIIFKNDPLGDAGKSIEADLINIFKRVNTNILHDFISDKQCIKSLSKNT